MGKLRSSMGEFVGQADLVLLGLCVGATCFGIVLIASATHYMGTYKYVLIQAAALVLGILAYVLFSMLDVEGVSKYWKWILAFNILFILLLLTPLGKSSGGNRAWLGISAFPVRVQPAEIVKITFTILLARQLAWLRERGDLKSLSAAGYVGGHLLFMVALIFAVSSDAGSCLVYVFVFFCMAFASGFALRWFAAALALFSGAFAFLWNADKLPTYMKKRIMTLFDHTLEPSGVSWHQTRSLLAIGSGRLTGQGLFHGTQTQSSYSGALPARQTDFIFSVAGEELGMLGCLAILAILTLIILRCLRVAKRAKTPMEQYICVGMAGMLIFQTVENVGMCLFLMPVIGLTLPFFSYGGSSIVTLFCAMGIVSGIKKRSRPEWLR